MSYIYLKDLVKRYNGNLAVDNVSLKIEKGELFGLLGPNGAGKSTTIKMVMGLLSPNAGEIQIDGLDIRQNKMAVRRMLGLVPQEIAIYETLSAGENVAYFGSLYGLRGAELRTKSQEALEFVGLKDRIKQNPKTFSGGMKRRLNIACAIVHQPPILIMDEPTVGIDPQSRNHILESVKELNRQGSTIIYTSHYMDEVEVLCPRVGIMDQGKLIACGTKESLEKAISSGEKVLVQIGESSETLLNEIKEIPGVLGASKRDGMLEIHAVKAQDALQDVLFVLAKNEIRVENISIKEPNLESLFLELTGRTLRD